MHELESFEYVLLITVSSLCIVILVLCMKCVIKMNEWMGQSPAMAYLGPTDEVYPVINVGSYSNEQSPAQV